jgi:hypothetical protein
MQKLLIKSKTKVVFFINPIAKIQFLIKLKTPNKQKNKYTKTNKEKEPTLV